MIKIKAKFDTKNSTLKWSYNANNTSTIENMCVIWNLFDTILDQNDDISEEMLIDLIKKRKNFEQKGGDECDE